MFTLLICADLYGEKANLEVTFPHMPTIGDLHRRVVEVYTSEASLKRPEGYPVINFTISKLQIYDDVMLKWTDLVTCSQLHEYDQLYAFQPQSPWHTDIQKDLPPPRPPTIVQRVQTATYGPNRSQMSAGTPVKDYTETSMSAYHNTSQPLNGFSPTRQRIEDQRRREEELRQQLRAVHEETERLEAQAAREREEELRRQQAEMERAIRQKEEDIRSQREALQRGEDELRRLQASATPLRGDGVSRSL